MKPRIFVGSSSEAVSTAKIVEKQFKGRYNVASWNNKKQDVFEPTEYTLDSLLSAAGESNFGIFVFAADDVVTIRDSTERVVRDNVLLESGIFFGRLGRHRTFLLVPRDLKVHLPSDFAGLNVAYYRRGNRGIADACSAIEKKIRKQLHKHESPSLNGKWQQTWRVPRTGKFGGENTAPAEVLHIGDQFLANCADKIQPFSVSGTVENFFITGTWRNAGSLGYFGSFQLQILPG